MRFSILRRGLRGSFLVSQVSESQRQSCAGCRFDCNVRYAKNVSLSDTSDQLVPCRFRRLRVATRGTLNIYVAVERCRIGYLYTCGFGIHCPKISILSPGWHLKTVTPLISFFVFACNVVNGSSVDHIFRRLRLLQ